MLRGAIWDLDGTILDSMSAWDHVGENYLRSQGIEPKPDLDEAIATMSLHQAADYFIEHYGVKQTRDELIKSAVAIVDDFYRYDEKNMCVEGVHTGKKIYPGNEMTVTVKNVDLMARTIDFEAVDR